MAFFLPEIRAEYSSRNERELNSYKTSSHFKVWWQCSKDSKHEWQTSLDNRTRGGTGCPFCAGKRTTEKKCFSIESPHLLLEWDYDKNEKGPSEYMPQSGKKVWWKCDKGHSWESRIQDRSKGMGKCRTCNFHPISETHPDLVEEWHPTLNGEQTPDTISSGINHKVWWICPQGHDYEMSPNNRCKGSSCGICHRQHYNKSKPKGDRNEKSLVEHYPELVKEWDHDKNKLSPSRYSYGSNLKVWWVCSKVAEHKWEEKIHNRVYNNCGCPYCSGQRFTSERSLASRFPHLLEQWHPTKNGDLKPKEIWGSTKKVMVWWRCKVAADHEWRSSVDMRSKKKGKCPFCDGKRVCESNCLQTTHPKLCKEWHKEKNGKLTPSDITYGSTKKVWWKCSKKGHEWQAILSNRSKGIGCPFCLEYKGEEAIVKVLSKMNISYSRQKGYDTCRYSPRHKLKFDFWVDCGNSVEILIEFNGIQHYEPVKFFGGAPSFENQQARDKVKSDWCVSNDVPLLVIPYTDIDRIPELVEAFVNEYSGYEEPDFIVISDDEDEI